MGAPYNPPTKNASFETYVSLRSFATPGSMQANPTLAAGDVKAYLDGVASTLGAGASANLITLPTVVGATVVVKVALGSTEMNFDNITIVFIDQTSPKEWEDLVINIVPGTGGSGGGASAADIWDYLTSAISTSGSIGKLLKDDIDVVLSSGIQARLPASLVSGRIDASVGAMASAVLTATAIDADAITNGKIADNAIAVENIADGAITAAKVADGTIDAATFAAGAINAAAIATDAIDADALKTDAANEIADAMLDRAAGVETGYTLRQALRLILSGIAGKISGAGTANVLIRDVNDSKNRISAVVDASGNRTTVTKDVS